MSLPGSASPLRCRFPFGGLLVAAVAGILCSDLLPTRDVLSVFLFLGFVLFVLCSRSSPLALGTVFTGFFLIHCLEWQEAPARRLAAWSDRHPGVYRVEGVVTGVPKGSHPDSLSFPLRIVRLTDPEGREVDAQVTVLVRWAGPDVDPGDRLSCEGLLGRAGLPRNPGEMDFRAWLERRGIFSVLRVDPSIPGTVLASGCGNPLLELAGRAREAAMRILSVDLPGRSPETGAIQGICLGITENAPEGFLDEFRFTGTMHLFAVSGLHVGMVAVILWFLLAALRLPRGALVALSIPALFFYVAVTGFKSGSLRAATMASLLMLGLVFFRRSPPVNTLAAAAFLQLAADTNELFSAGWQFSYSVVLAILLVSPWLQRHLVPLHVRDEFLPPRLLTRRERLGFACWAELSALLAVSVSAWIGSLLPTAAYFHLISFSALGANVLAVPLAFAVLSLGMLSLMTGWFSLWIAGAFNNANWLVVKILLTVVQGSAFLPGGHWFVGPQAAPFPEMILPDLGGASCAVIRDRGAATLVDAGSSQNVRRILLPLLEAKGVNRIASLFVTREDAAHLGGIPDLAKELRIGAVFLPPERGRSPVADKVVSSMRHSLPLLPGRTVELSPHVTMRALATSREGSVLKVALGGVTILFIPGNAPGLCNQLESLPEGDVNAEVLHLPLGGLDIEKTLSLIRKVAPSVVISPSGGLSRSSSLSSEWSALLAGEGIRLLRQDETGALMVDDDPLAPQIRSYLPGVPVMFLRKRSPGAPPQPLP